jgi:hypothetical protein
MYIPRFSGLDDWNASWRYRNEELIRYLLPEALRGFAQVAFHLRSLFTERQSTRPNHRYI